MKKKKASTAQRKARSARPHGSALDRIVLAEGYPWANGTGPGYFEITMRHKAQGGINLPMNWPPALWGVDVAKYRLVLERVDAARSCALTTKLTPLPPRATVERRKDNRNEINS